MIDILDKLNTGKTRRLHTHEVIKEQNIAEHSWGVAIILMELTYVEPNYLTKNLLQAAILHDSAEALIGDIPYFTKKSLGSPINKLEKEANKRLGIKIELTELEKLLLDVADLLELGYKCYKERLLGNTTLDEISDTVFNLVFDMSQSNILPKSIEYRILTLNERLKHEK